MDNEILTTIIKLSESSSSFAVILWAAFLLKKYVINGTIDRFFVVKQKEIDGIIEVKELLVRLVDMHEQIENRAKDRSLEDGCNNKLSSFRGVGRFLGGKGN